MVNGLMTAKSLARGHSLWGGRRAGGANLALDPLGAGRAALLDAGEVSLVLADAGHMLLQDDLEQRLDLDLLFVDGRMEVVIYGTDRPPEVGVGDRGKIERVRTRMFSHTATPRA